MASRGGTAKERCAENDLSLKAVSIFDNVRVTALRGTLFCVVYIKLINHTAVEVLINKYSLL